MHLGFVQLKQKTKKEPKLHWFLCFWKKLTVDKTLLARSQSEQLFFLLPAVNLF